MCTCGLQVAGSSWLMVLTSCCTFRRAAISSTCNHHVLHPQAPEKAVEWCRARARMPPRPHGTSKPCATVHLGGPDFQARQLKFPWDVRLQHAPFPGLTRRSRRGGRRRCRAHRFPAAPLAARC